MTRNKEELPLYNDLLKRCERLEGERDKVRSILDAGENCSTEEAACGLLRAYKSCAYNNAHRITTLLAVIEQCESHFKQITLVPCDEENVYDMWHQMHEEAKEGVAAIKKVKESK